LGEQGNKAYFAMEKPKKKETCRRREQVNIVKYVLETKERRETFEVNTGTKTPWETLKEDISRESIDVF
jgi:uncharacterized membrane protein (UPF0127 family)